MHLEISTKKRVARAIGCPKTHFFLQTHNLLVSQKMTQTLFFFTLHPLSTVIFATATVLAFVLLRDSRFKFHCYTHSVKQRLLRDQPGSALQPLATSCMKDYKAHDTLANQLC